MLGIVIESYSWTYKNNTIPLTEDQIHLSHHSGRNGFSEYVVSLKIAQSIKINNNLRRFFLNIC
jgi:hypothetical protein